MNGIGWIARLSLIFLIQKNRLVACCAWLLVAIAPSVNAEVLHNIEPLDTLGSIRAKYPNAVLTRVKAAWVTESEDFYSLRGQGFPGTLYIAFNDSRPFYRKTLAQRAAKASESGTPATPNATMEALANQSDDVALDASWVRWVPESPIPLERYKSKYGEPSKCSFREDTMRPFCDWTPRALSVSLSDDQKFVLNTEATFTRGEQRAAWLRRWAFIPDDLKDEEPAAPRPASGSARKPIKKAP